VSAEIITWIFLASGVLLMASEFLLPGMVSVFLGSSAILVAALRFAGILEGLPASLATWMVSSIVMVLLLRKALLKWFPPDVEHGSSADVNEDLQSYGQIVEVLVDCDEATGEAGRIKLDGVAWPAHSTHGVLKKGMLAKVCYRKNMTWFIEPHHTLEEKRDDGLVPLRENETEAAKSKKGGE